MAFVPTPFATPVVAPSTYQQGRKVSYITPSWYRFAPTSVGTRGLVIGSNDTQVDSTASLAQIISRASAWVDSHCFHGGDGSFAGSVTVEQDLVQIKPDGSIVLICNLKPVREVVGIALGGTPGNLTDIGPNTAGNVVLQGKTITLPAVYDSGNPTGWYGPWPSVNGMVMAVYSYVSGWPHSTLAADAAEGDSTLVVAPPVPGATQLYGAYAGSQLTIKDGQNTETVTLAAASDSLTLSLAAPLQYDHTVPEAPDAINVTAMPDDIEQATISMVNVLIKTQGMRAQQLPGSIGTASPQQQKAMSRAGALGDFEAACMILHPYRTTFLHS